MVINITVFNHHHRRIHGFFYHIVMHFCSAYKSVLEHAERNWQIKVINIPKVVSDNRIQENTQLHRSQITLAI